MSAHIYVCAQIYAHTCSTHRSTTRNGFLGVTMLRRKEGKVDAGGKQLSLDVLTNKTEEAVFFFNNVVATTVSSKGYFAVPDMSDMLAGKGAEFEAIKDFCSGSVKDMVKDIEDKAQEELLQLGYKMAEHLHIEGTMDFELEEATQLFRAVSFIAQDWSKVQKTHLWRVRERAVYWATMLSLRWSHEFSQIICKINRF